MSTAAPQKSLAVLVSGGLDSAILLGESIRSHDAVFPLYVRCGLTWETVEEFYLIRFLEALRCPTLRPLHVLEMPVNDLYQDHWSQTGTNVPGAETPDEAVFLPGRNVLLLSKSLLWCHLNDIPALALAPLAGNPFPDASPDFLASYAAIVNQAIGGNVHLKLPYRHLGKTEVLRRGREMPLDLTFSCIRPIDARHCGACNKCAERRRAFVEAGMLDPTVYLAE